MVWENESYQKGLESTCKCPCAALSAGWLWLSQSLNISNFYGGVGVFPTQVKCGGGSEITQHQDCTVPLWYLELQPGQQGDPIGACAEKQVSHCPPEKMC